MLKVAHVIDILIKTIYKNWAIIEEFKLSDEECLIWKFNVLFLTIIVKDLKVCRDGIGKIEGLQQVNC